ncbi:sigma-54-dependent Fis family transcriptional regulator [Endothiovibrio diazotrophicus]
MSSTAVSTALRKARMRLIEHGECSPGTVDERIARSWRRSLAAGLSPTGRLSGLDALGGQPLRRLLARNHDLLAHARPVMEYLHGQLRESHSMIILADRQATLMQALGDCDFLTKAERVALSVGASWQECFRGTNAIGTSLAEAQSVEINGAEHFLERNGFLTCAAAPIMAADGSLLGVIDVSGDQRNRHPHTLGLVGMAARMIENRLLIADPRHAFRLRLHAYPEGIGSVAEGIVALSGEGEIVGANRAGLAMLGLGPLDLGGTPLRRVIDARLGELLARHRRQPRQPLAIRRRDGSPLFARLELERTVVVSAASAPPRPPADALAALDTGDAAWRAAADKARRVVGKPIPLLILGESGVGKELFARAVHDSGPRRDGPFVAINCAALPENLIEAELFGYSAGAFTGARREGCRGRLREAHGGTLFLDEIGDMPLALQGRLLRVLQERQVVPLGGGKAVDVDFALVCATHRKLREAVDCGAFRGDLYYRIAGLTLRLPALRERGDLPALSERLLEEISPEREVTLSPEVMARFARYRWPGNLRQYANVLRTACAMLEEGEGCIEWRHLDEALVEELTELPSVPAAEEEEVPRNLHELSMAAIRRTLEACRGNVSQAARQLGISRQTLYRKLKRG